MSSCSTSKRRPDVGGASSGVRRRCIHSTGSPSVRRPSSQRRSSRSPLDGTAAGSIWCTGPEHVGLVDAHEIGGDAPDARGDRRRHLVGVDLIAREHEEMRSRVRCAGRDACDDHVGGERQPVATAAVHLAARGVQHGQLVDGGGRAGKGGLRRADGDIGPVRLRPGWRHQPILVERGGVERPPGGIAGDRGHPQVAADLQRCDRRAGDLGDGLAGDADRQCDVAGADQRDPDADSHSGQSP
jgi:hypothetical protein